MGRMRAIHYITIILIMAGSMTGGLAGSGCAQKDQESKEKKEASAMLKHVHWLGHAGFKITGEKVIYIDPYKIEGGETADIILVTHGHGDHLSLKDIEKIRGEKTIIVVSASAAGSLEGNVKTVSPGDKITVHGVKIQAVPAYNVGKRFHPKEDRHVGYVFTVNGVSFYHAGDTDRIPEMKDIQADVVFLPVGGTYTMNGEEAARAAEDIGPKIAIPMHWGNVIGSKKDAETFKRLCRCDVHILEVEK